MSYVCCIFHVYVYSGFKEDAQTSAIMHRISASWKGVAIVQHYRGREMMLAIRNASPCSDLLMQTCRVKTMVQ
jgi:hypothetical protein